MDMDMDMGWGVGKRRDRQTVRHGDRYTHRQPETEPTLRDRTVGVTGHALHALHSYTTLKHM